MASRATGLDPRRGYQLDRESVLLGAVKAGPRGSAAATLTGAERILTTTLNSHDTFKVVCFGQTSNAAGGYLIQVAHLPEGQSAPAGGDYVTIDAIEASGISVVEKAFSGKDVGEQCLAAAGDSGDPRVVAIKLTAGTGANGADAPAGTMTIAVLPAN